MVNANQPLLLKACEQQLSRFYIGGILYAEQIVVALSTYNGAHKNGHDKIEG